MAGNQMPVLTLDVNEDQIKRLEAIFEKYQNALKIGPGGFPMRIPDQSGSRSRGRTFPLRRIRGKTEQKPQAGSVMKKDVLLVQVRVRTRSSATTK